MTSLTSCSHSDNVSHYSVHAVISVLSIKSIYWDLLSFYSTLIESPLARQHVGSVESSSLNLLGSFRVVFVLP